MAHQFDPIKARADEMLASKSEEKAATFDDKDKFLNFIIQLGGAGISIFIIGTMLLFPLPAMMQRAAVLMLSFLVIFLLYPMFKRNRGLNCLNWAWAILAVVVCGYVLVDFENLVNRMGALNTTDKILGGLCIIMVLDATRRAIGWPLPIVTIIFLLYAYFGYLIPGSFGHRGYDVHRILNQMYMTTEGIFGIPLGVVVTIVFLFILFGAFLDKGGGGKFFIDLAVSLAGRLRGGPAKIAVLSSGLMGMISGSSIANVATTGTFTIPLMKRIGYKPEFAGAVEATASTGGQIMPPIMGAAAFIMAEFTQTAYVKIIVMAIVPATLYYLSVYMNVHFEACRTGMKGLPENEIPKASAVLKYGWIFILPVIGLIVVLVMGYSPSRAAFTGMGLMVIAGMFKASSRLTIKGFWDVLTTAGRNAVGIAAACACAGIIVGTTSMTGLGVKLAMLIEFLAAGKLIVALLLTALASLILGMALPTTANYIVQASVAAPALIALGVPVLTAHMFVFYFGVYADITPPVALAAYTAAGISKGDPMMTGVIASRNVLVGFIIPFLFVYHPGLVLQGPIIDILMMVVSTGFSVVAFSAAFGNFLYRRCRGWERVGLLIAAVLLITPGLLTDLTGFVVLAAIYIWQRRTNDVPPATLA
ncbi:MAG: TRAP transporter permease [Syntrophales bacterium]|jgi:TRAP transporter 4TM/12TM fusion protein|nr:TRAP transporter permease [Syntrophales bacterium]